MVVTQSEKDLIEGIRVFKKAKDALRHSEELENYVNELFHSLMD